MLSSTDENPQDKRIKDLQEALRLGLAVVSELWSYAIKDWISSVHAADIDGDGDVEILFGSRSYRLYILTKLGDLKRELTVNSEWVGTVLGIDDTKAVDNIRVLVGTRNSTVHGFDGNLQQLWQYNADLVIRQLEICDINRDGKLEVIIASEDRFIHVLSCEDGTFLWKFPTGAFVRCIAVADIDGDGEIEILGGSGDSHLYVLNSQGQLKWSYNAGGKIYSIFAVDLDNDGVQEILLSTDSKDLYALRSDWQQQQPSKKWSVHLDNRVLSLFVIDLNKDGRLEILAGSEDKHLYIFNDQGELLWKHYLGARIFSIYVTDVDRDGLLEVLIGGDDNNIHVLRIELSGGERERILMYYELLGRPTLSEIGLSSTERALLAVLIDQKTTSRQNYTLQDLEEVSRTGDTKQILFMLLELEQQKAQVQWCRDVGYVRTLDLSPILGGEQLEIIVGTTQGNICVLNADGEEYWRYHLGDRIRTVQSGDIDNDGDREVVAGSTDGQVYALNKTGDTIKWSSKLKDWITSLSIVPAANPGHVELIMGSEEKRIHIYADNLTPVLEPILVPQGIYVMMVGDINQDGIPEIIAGAVDNNVYAYTRDGVLLWIYKTPDRVRALAIADINGDKRQEIIVGSEDRTVHVLDSQGHLQWRYYTPHRLLDICVADTDQDGAWKIFLGCGNNHVYVLSSEGEYLWDYLVNDRVRIVRVADIDKDGIQELLIGSEDQLYLLKLFNLQQLQQHIASCWQMLQQERPTRDLLNAFFQHNNPILRAFALKMLAQDPHLFGTYPVILNSLVNDPSPIVRSMIARKIPAFYQAYPEAVRRLFNTLVSDRKREVRLAFVESLPALVEINHELGFAYLERLTKNVDRWVRRAVVRELYKLAKPFPQQVFRLLTVTAQDERIWVRQESARSLAHYFDLHTDNLIEGSRSLIAKGIDLAVHELIAHQATNPIIQNIFRVMVDLFSELDEANLQSRLQSAVQAFESAIEIKYGLEIWHFYKELYRLSGMRNIDEIARYKYTLDGMPSSLWVHFEDTLEVLRQLTIVSNVLNRYLRREGLGDRLASLYEANKTIDVIYAKVKEKVSEVIQEDRQQLSDITIFRLVLKRWRAIVSTELSRLIGQAELRLEINKHALLFEEKVSFWLTIYNSGNSPADTVTIQLRPGPDFAIVGNGTIEIELVPSRDSVQVEFTITPFTNRPHLSFKVVYNDAASKEKICLLGDKLELDALKREYHAIINPYSVGMPIRDEDMFYGRQEDLATLKADLINPDVSVTIVLFGQRRSGKTSLLNQLVNTMMLAPHIPIYVDMQNESLGITISKFLRNIAHYIQKALRKRNISLQAPSLKDFEDDPTFTFNCFLDEVEEYLEERKLLLFIDEFEILEQKVKEKALPQEIFEYLRSLMQHREKIRFLFSGTHTIKQLTANYWSVFFNIARHYRLSELGEEAATQLIVQPVQDVLEYDTFAVQKIRQLTANQPYLIQLICRALVDHCNAVQKNYVTITDVNRVLDVVMETGEVHFQWIWQQTDLQERILLSILAQEGGEDQRLLSLIDIEEIYISHGLAYDHKKVLQALSGLREKDIIENSANNTRFRVLLGLSQRWLRETKSLRRVMLEENLLSQK
jgi:outer membrane protein assembly factor BamB